MKRISDPLYSFSDTARLARIEVSLRVSPNKLSDWRGSLRDWGFALYTRGEGTNGNLPTLYTMRCDGQEFYFDGPFHVWLPVSASEQVTTPALTASDRVCPNSHTVSPVSDLPQRVSILHSDSPRRR